MAEQDVEFVVDARSRCPAAPTRDGGRTDVEAVQGAGVLPVVDIVVAAVIALGGLCNIVVKPRQAWTYGVWSMVGHQLSKRARTAACLAALRTRLRAPMVLSTLSMSHRQSRLRKRSPPPKRVDESPPDAHTRIGWARRGPHPKVMA